MKVSMTLVAVTALVLAACEWTVEIHCDDGNWDPTALTCESVTQAAAVRLGGMAGVMTVEIIGPEGCPPGGRGCAFNSDVAIVAVTTMSGRELSFLVTVENGRVVAGPIEESAPDR